MAQLNDAYKANPLLKQRGVQIDFTREQLSGYKLPKQILFVDEVMRAPNGKANYKWAKEEAVNKLG